MPAVADDYERPLRRKALDLFRDFSPGSRSTQLSSNGAREGFRDANDPLVIDVQLAKRNELLYQQVSTDLEYQRAPVIGAGKLVRLSQRV